MRITDNIATEAAALKAVYEAHCAACIAENVWTPGFDEWFLGVARRASPEIKAALKANVSMRHDLVTTAGLWAIDHRPLSEPDAFQVTHPSLGKEGK